MEPRAFVEQNAESREVTPMIVEGVDGLGGLDDELSKRYDRQEDTWEGKGVIRPIDLLDQDINGLAEQPDRKSLKSNPSEYEAKLFDTSMAMAERETSVIMSRKINEMTAAGSILIDPTHPDAMLRAEIEALRAICEEPLRISRRATYLDGPGWKSFEEAGKVYQLLAFGKAVWRCCGEEGGGEEVQWEEIQGTVLEKAGYLWQRERGRWDRLPAPDEGDFAGNGRVEIEEAGGMGAVVGEGSGADLEMRGT